MTHLMTFLRLSTTTLLMIEKSLDPHLYLLGTAIAMNTFKVKAVNRYGVHFKVLEHENVVCLKLLTLVGSVMVLSDWKKIEYIYKPKSRGVVYLSSGYGMGI